MDLYRKGIAELSEMLGKHEVSSIEIAASVFGRIDRVEDTIKAYVTLTKDAATGMAVHIDREIAAGNKKTLSGIPIAIKDNMCTQGIATTCASKMSRILSPTWS